jgi:hypothetical protein
MSPKLPSNLRQVAIAGSVLCAFWAIFWLELILHSEVPLTFMAVGTSAYFLLLAGALALSAGGRKVLTSSFWPLPVVCLLLVQEARLSQRLEAAAIGGLVASIVFVAVATILERRLKKIDAAGRPS